MTLILQLRGPKVVTVQGDPFSKGPTQDMNAGLADPKAHVAGRFCLLVYKCICESCFGKVHTSSQDNRTSRYEEATGLSL